MAVAYSVMAIRSTISARPTGATAATVLMALMVSYFLVAVEVAVEAAAVVALRPWQCSRMTPLRWVAYTWAMTGSILRGSMASRVTLMLSEMFTIIWRAYAVASGGLKRTFCSMRLLVSLLLALTT
jgi:hypothetical protein